MHKRYIGVKQSQCQRENDLLMKKIERDRDDGWGEERNERTGEGGGGGRYYLLSECMGGSCELMYIGKDSVGGLAS